MSSLMSSSLTRVGVFKAGRLAAVCAPRSAARSRGLKSDQATMASHTLTMDSLNPCIKSMEYAVRGPLVIRATEIEKELQSVSVQKKAEGARAYFCVM